MAIPPEVLDAIQAAFDAAAATQAAIAAQKATFDALASATFADDKAKLDVSGAQIRQADAKAKAERALSAALSNGLPTP